LCGGFVEGVVCGGADLGLRVGGRRGEVGRFVGGGGVVFFLSWLKGGHGGCGLELVASKRALASAPSSSSPSCVSCSASFSSYNSSHVRSQKALTLRSSFVARTTHSSFWDGGGTYRFFGIKLLVVESFFCSF
jgi:hypothetical protein